MKLHIIRFAMLLILLSFPASRALAGDGDKNAEPKPPIWGYADNLGEGNVILHIKMTGDKYTDVILPGHKVAILPKGTEQVKVVPITAEDEKNTDVIIAPSDCDPAADEALPRGLRRSSRFYQSGGTHRFGKPIEAATRKELINNLKPAYKDLIIPPGALTEADADAEVMIQPGNWKINEPNTPEKTSPQPEPKQTEDKPAAEDSTAELRKWNEQYIKQKAELEKATPGGALEERLKDSLEQTKEAIDSCIAKEEEQYGPNWRERYRDQSGKLPGGFIEDDKSRLIKLKELRDEQQEKVSKLNHEFEDLKKKTRPIAAPEEYIKEAQDKFREDFIKENGTPDNWTEQQRKEYMEGMSNAADKGSEQWKEDNDRLSKDNKKLGRTMKALAEAKADLKRTDNAIEKIEERSSADKESPPSEESPQNASTPKTELSHYTIPQAIEAVETMISDVNKAAAKHANIFNTPDFMRCYYIKAGIPSSVMDAGKMLMDYHSETLYSNFESYGQGKLWEFVILNEKGKQLAAELASLLDVYDGHTVIPVSESLYRDPKDWTGYMHTDQALRILNGILDSLKAQNEKGSDVVVQNLVIRAKKLMGNWRRNIIQYHNALDIYLENAAQYMKIIKYENGKLNEPLSQLDEKYKNRTPYNKEMKQYSKELERVLPAIKKQREQLNKKADDIFNKLVGNGEYKRAVVECRKTQLEDPENQPPLLVPQQYDESSEEFLPDKLYGFLDSCKAG